MEPAGPEPTPLSGLQHAVCCLRQAALIHGARLRAENRLTAEGAAPHAVADKGGGRRSRGARQVMSLPLASRRLNLSGVADVAEFRAVGDPEVPFPVEHKRATLEQSPTRLRRVVLFSCLI